MSSVSLSGSDTVQINSRVLNDLADQDAVVLDFPNELAAMKVSKNGNAIYGENMMGRAVDCTLRVLLGSSDDKFLNSVLQQQKNGLSDFTLLTGAFSKRVGDGKGTISTSVYQLTDGFFKKSPGAKTNADGDTEQSVAVYQITFRNGDKSIQ